MLRVSPQHACKGPLRGRSPWLPKAALTLLTLGALAGAKASPAQADLVPSSSKRIRYSYEVTGLEKHPEVTLVLWPRACGSRGEPMGTVDLGLNPQWKEHFHDVDYEVIVPGQRAEIGKFCAGTAHLYALPAREFRTEKSVSAEKQWQLGLEAGQPMLRVPALDKLDLAQRMAFFAKSGKARRAAYAFTPPDFVHRRSQVDAVHDVLHATLGRAGLAIGGAQAVYTYRDGTTESLAYPKPGAERPQPTRKGALVPLKPGYSDDEEDPPVPAPPMPVMPVRPVEPEKSKTPAEPPEGTSGPVYRPVPESGLGTTRLPVAPLLAGAAGLAVLLLLLRARPRR